MGKLVDLNEMDIALNGSLRADCEAVEFILEELKAVMREGYSDDLGLIEKHLHKLHMDLLETHQEIAAAAYNLGWKCIWERIGFEPYVASNEERPGENHPKEVSAEMREALEDNPETVRQEETESNYFGGCPVCGKNDGFLNIGRNHFFVCDRHKKAWWGGMNLFSCWKEEDEDTWRKNAEKLDGYELDDIEIRRFRGMLNGVKKEDEPQKGEAKAESELGNLPYLASSLVGIQRSIHDKLAETAARVDDLDLVIHRLLGKNENDDGITLKDDGVPF